MEPEGCLNRPKFASKSGTCIALGTVSVKPNLSKTQINTQRTDEQMTQYTLILTIDMDIKLR